MNKNNEIPVQLDLEGGFVVGQNPESATIVKEETDESYSYGEQPAEIRAVKEEPAEECKGYDYLSIKEESYEYDDCAIKQEDDTSYDYIKEEVDGDAYCMDDYEPLDKDESDDDSRKATSDQASSKQPDQASNKDLPRSIKTIIGPPPTLLRMTTETVASNIEKYQPLVFSLLSECQWESIVECRCESFHKVESSIQKRNKLLMPPISAKNLMRIESHPANVHIGHSSKVDTLLWKKIVNYSFPKKGITRPSVLEEPCEVLVTRLKEWGDNLVELFEWNEENGKTDPGQPNERRKSCDDSMSRRKSDETQDSDEEGVKELNCPNNATSQNDLLSSLSRKRTQILVEMLTKIQRSPMDVHLLSVSGIGRCVSKVVKIATKLLKQMKQNGIEGIELFEALNGYPHFWTDAYRLCRLGNNPHTVFTKSTHVGLNEESKTVTLLQLLQQLLQEWKDMASANGVAISSTSCITPPPTKKHKTDSTNKSNADETRIPFCTFGKLRHSDSEQHQTDMKLLHSSPNWKALYQSLQKREKMVREAHGEKVRASRESLEKNRAKVGHVKLKKAVGRARGLGSPCASLTIGQDRREAILNKSLGMRAQVAEAARSSCGNSSRSTKKLSKLKQESKVQVKWSKGTRTTVSKINHTSSTPLSGFGAAVARAGGNGTKRPPKTIGNQTRVDLQGGKRMTLPAAASSKSIGMFTSLQKGGDRKKSAAERISLKTGKRKR